MSVPFSRSLPRQPLWVWAVLGGSIAATYAVELAASVYTYQAWETDAREAGRVMYGTMAEHLALASQWWAFIGLLTILGFALALRGRRILFAVPALAFAFVPLIVDAYHGSFGLFRPGLNDRVGLLAYDKGIWVWWLVSAINLVLVLLPGIVVATQVKTNRNPLHLLAIGVMAVPVWLVGYYAVIYYSYSGQLETGEATGLVVAFFVGAAMGFDRPLWPWVIIAIPLLTKNRIYLPLDMSGPQGYGLAASLLLGAVTVPFGRVLQRGWRQSSDPQQAHESGGRDRAVSHTSERPHHEPESALSG